MPRLGPALITALTAWVLLGAGQAHASHVQCGEVIRQDTKLDSDLIDCPGDGLVIGAANVTLDLNGHTVDGDGDPRSRLGCDTGIVNGRFDSCGGQDHGHNGVTIRGGTVREFAQGVQVVLADRSSLSRLRVYDNSGLGGIATYLMSNGRIEHNRALGNSTGIAVYEPEGRTTIAGNVVGLNSVEGIELAGGVAGDRLEGNVAFGNGAHGFFVFYPRDLLIAGNRAYGNRGAGVITFEGHSYIEHNDVSDNGSGGIAVIGDDSRIVENRAFGNAGIAGITIEAETGGNVVASNHVRDNTGHGIDHSAVVDVHGIVMARNHSTGNGEDGIHVGKPMHDLDTQVEASALLGNRADRNGDDGIDVMSDTVALRANRTMRNADLGIEAVPGVTDSGGNRAFGNGNPLQCLNVFCREVRQ